MPDTRQQTAGTCLSGSEGGSQQAGQRPNQDLQRIIAGIRVDEYALLVPLEITRSSLVVSDSGNLVNSDRLPYEVFPARSAFRTDGVLEASAEMMEAVGLAGIFSPAAGATIGSFALEAPGAKPGNLLFKLRPGQSIEDVLAFCVDRKEEITELLNSQRNLAASYEWEILKNILNSTEPCLVADQQGYIVAANAMFCNLVGACFDDLIGYRLQQFIHLQEDIESDIPNFPAHEEMLTPLYVKTQSLFFMSDIGFSRLRTVCGDRFIYVFRDLLTDQRTGNSNIQLAQKLSSMIMDPDSPQVILRKLINVLTLTLDADLVCILKRNEKDELVMTPYSNRRLETIRVDFIEPEREPVLEPYFKNGSPVFCEDVEKECSENSFFRRVLPVSRFAFVPAGHGTVSEHTLLVAWLGSGAAIGARSLSLFRIVANLIGSVLAHAKLLSEIEQEKETLRRYAKLTAGREVRMAGLKRENAQLKEMIRKLSIAVEARAQK